MVRSQIIIMFLAFFVTMCYYSSTTTTWGLVAPRVVPFSHHDIQYTATTTATTTTNNSKVSPIMSSRSNFWPMKRGKKGCNSVAMDALKKSPTTKNTTSTTRTSDSSLVFARRSPSQRRLNCLLSRMLSLLQMILWRTVILTPTIAMASSVSSSSTSLSSSFASSTHTLALSSQSSAMTIGRRRIIHALQSILPIVVRPFHDVGRPINTRNLLKMVLTTGFTIYTFINIIEMWNANRRQTLDPTSEWGRYADNPSARGMALSVLLMRLVPYAVLPNLIEKITGKSRRNNNNNNNDDEYVGYADKDEYESSRAHKLRKKGGRIIADGLLRLGPLYIKIGQILSCQENLFPKEWITAMEKLQDRVPAKSGWEAYELLYEACPGGKVGFHETFTDFDDVPLAAASLGQVHTATLRSTRERVAIKIQRARLRDIYDKDLALMKKISSIADSLGKASQVGGVEQSWEGIFKDAETILYREIDYRDEANNAIRFASDFGIGRGGVPVESTAKGVDGNALPSAAEWMRTPHTYAELSSEKFLVMEYVPSIKVTNNEKLREAKVTNEDREYLAEALARAYLRQFCTHKFFSTDPHPGNLGIEVFDDGRPPRMVFYDFGQACSLSHDQAGGILEVIESIIDLDAKKSVAAFARMGVLKENANLEKVQAKCQQNYDMGKLKVKRRKKRSNSRYSLKYQDSIPVENELNELEMRLEASEKLLTTNQSTVEKVNDAEVMGYFTLKSEYAFVARALSQMDGVGKSLDPEFDFISASAPYLVEVKGTGRYLSDEIKKRLNFIYDPDDGVLAKELALFKSLGFSTKR